MIPTILLIGVLASGALLADTTRPVSVHSITASRVIKVGEPSAAAKVIATGAEGLNGWVVAQEPERISIRIPAASVESFLLNVDTLGLIMDRSYFRNDNTNEYWRLIAQIRAKEKLLTEYLQVLDSARSEAIYPVSRGITDLQRSIEEISGRIRGLEQRSAMAEVQIYFQFHNRRPPPATGLSNFAWLNKVDMRLLIEDFQQ